MWIYKLYLIQSRMEIKKAMLDYFKDSTDESDYQDLTLRCDSERKPFEDRFY